MCKIAAQSFAIVKEGNCADAGYRVITNADECQQAAEMLTEEGLVDIQEHVPTDKERNNVDKRIAEKLGHGRTRLPHCAYSPELPYFTFNLDDHKLGKCSADYSCVCKTGACVQIII